jgi:pilus assembly protein FimV
MLRKTVVILTMLLCSMATQLYALELGAVTVESALNQPLRMRVELLQLGDTQLQDISVSMASSADFERLNIDRDSVLSNIRFSVESTSQGSVVILTSSQIVREPYLSLILDTRWPNGRLLSEHTILLDLPVFDGQQSTAEIRQSTSPILQPPTGVQATDAQLFVESSAVSAPSSASSAVSLEPEVMSAGPEVIEAEEEPTEPALVEPETRETDGSDTLSYIALQVRPNTVVSMQQTMLALQGLNPEAFADGNINGLRSGQVLRIPTLEEIQSIDPRDAVDEVARQNQEFAEVGVQPLAAPPDATPDQDDQPQGQLSVVSSDDEIDANNGAAELADATNETLDQRIAELETQLAQRSEEADRARIAREELDSRMGDLEAQITAAQEIIRLQDIQLAQLQESLIAAAADAQLIAEQQTILAAAEAEVALPADSPSSEADDVMRILAGNSIFILFGIALVILLLVVLMLRRNRAAKTDDIDKIAEQDFDADASTEDSEKDEAAIELQDYDPADLNSELDDIIGGSDEAENSIEVAEEVGPTEVGLQLNIITVVEQLIGEQQYRRALIMLNTSLQEQGDNEEVRAKISEVESLLEAEEVEQHMIDEMAKTEEAANRESETKSFLDDLGMDLDSFDNDEEANDPEVEEVKDEPVSAAVTVEVSVESDDVDTMFDLDGDDGAGESNVEELETEDAEPAEAAEIVIDDEIEFDIDIDGEPEKAVAASNVSDDDLTSDDDLNFLSDDDVEIQSVDEVEEVSTLSDDDETATKLELAYAYQKMGDREGATEILQEVIKEGSEEQAEEASKLLGSLDGKSD